MIFNEFFATGMASIARVRSRQLSHLEMWPRLDYAKWPRSVTHGWRLSHQYDQGKQRGVLCEPGSTGSFGEYVHALEWVPEFPMTNSAQTLKRFSQVVARQHLV